MPIPPGQPNHSVAMSAAIDKDHTLTDRSLAPDVDSDAEKQTQKQVLPPPNGGLVAWLQVAGAFFLFFNSW